MALDLGSGGRGVSYLWTTKLLPAHDLPLLTPGFHLETWLVPQDCGRLGLLSASDFQSGFRGPIWLSVWLSFFPWRIELVLCFWPWDAGLPWKDGICPHFGVAWSWWIQLFLSAPLTAWTWLIWDLKCLHSLDPWLGWMKWLWTRIHVRSCTEVKYSWIR